LRIDDHLRVSNRIAVEGGRREAEPLSLLRGENEPVLLGRSIVAALARRDSQHGMKGELSGATDDPQGFVGVRHSGKLDDDPAVPGALEAGLGDAELINASSEHLEGASDRVGVDLLALGVLRFEDDLRAPAQVEAQGQRTRQPKGAGGPDYGKDGK
jgi:hypothetical protein